MSRFNAKALVGATALLAIAGTTLGQATLEVVHPTIDDREFVGDTTRVQFSAPGVNGETITGVTAEVFVLRDDGAMVTVNNTPRAIPASAVYADATDFSVDGAFFAFDADPDVLIVDMGRALLGVTNDLRDDIQLGEDQVGQSDPFGTFVGVYIRYSVTTDGPSTIFTANAAGMPEDATDSNGGLDAGVPIVTDDAAAESPQYLAAPVLSSATISDPSTNPIANYLFNRVLNNGDANNNLNQFVLANITIDDLAINNAAPGMAPLGVGFGPTSNVLRATFPMGELSSGDTVGFRSDITGSDNLADARDFVGYSLVSVSATTSNAIALAATGAVFTAGSGFTGNNGQNTGVLQVIFNQAVSNAGSADSYDLLLNMVRLQDTNEITFGAPAIDPEDPTRVNITLDFDQAGQDDLGIAPNGLVLDRSPVLDFSSVGLDTNQQPYFVQVRDDGTTEPVDALGNDLDLSGTPFTDTNPVGDGIAPSLVFASAHDLDANGKIETVALTFDETVTGASNNGIVVTILDGSNTTDIDARDAETGDLPAAAPIDLMGNQTVPGTFTPLNVTVEIVAGEDNETFENNNAIAFNGLDLSVFGTNMAVTPSSQDTSNFQIEYDGTMGAITDAAGNAFSPDATVTQTVDTDRAPAALLEVGFFTGDNQGANNDQLIAEADGVVGNQDDNDRAVLVFSEDLADNTPDESFITADGVTFDSSNNNGGRLGGATTGNVLTIENDESVEYGPGTTVALAGGVDISDAAGNVAVGSGVAANRVAPYIPLQNDGGIIDSAFLVDDDNDGFVDRIFVQFTEDVAQMNIASDGSDFTSTGANSGTITGADTLAGGDDSIVVLTVTDGEISIANSSDITYNGTTAPMLITGAATGNSVTDNTNTTFTAQQINDPNVITNSPDVMIVTGTLTGLDGVSPAPIGTRIFATLAIPTIDSINVTHNSVDFAYRYDDREYGFTARNSLDAFNNVFLGFRRFLYLSRESDNTQVFDNNKEIDESDTDGSGFLTDVIDVSLNTRNLANLSFSGQGEVRSETVSGTASLQWRLLRGSSTVQGLYLNGFSSTGSILLSQSVISEAGGRYNLHVSGIGGAFTGSPLAALDLPVIIWAQLPTGEQFALTSIYSAATTNDHDADGQVGDGVVFAPNNLQQENDGSASDATTLNFSLANVSVKTIHPGWTMLPFGSASGFAAGSRDIPELPNGVSEGNIVTGATIAASPLEQFVFFVDNDRDGVWESGESLFIDYDTVDHLRFNLTTNGIQMGTGMTQAVGGYGIGVLNISGSTHGVFQFGAPLPAGPVFASNPITGSAANATQGWLLVVPSQGFSPASNYFTTNPGSDYIIFFDN
ncbi:MAG: hypothetical protein AAGH64_05125, partial [Planctomycetota bacterium]